MKTTLKYDGFIEYPTTSFLKYKDKIPFIRFYKNDHVYYGFYNQHIELVELHKKPIQTKYLLKNATLPNSQHIYVLNQVTKQIRGMQYQLLYVSNNQYLCLGYLDHQIVAFVLLTIELNTKGYYEIIDVQDIVERIKEKE